jgi:hypothetical protein
MHSLLPSLPMKETSHNFLLGSFSITYSGSSSVITVVIKGVPRQIGAAKSAPDNSAYDDSALRQIGAKTTRRKDKSAQRQIGATTNRRQCRIIKISSISSVHKMRKRVFLQVSQHQNYKSCNSRK